MQASLLSLHESALKPATYPVHTLTASTLRGITSVQQQQRKLTASRGVRYSLPHYGSITAWMTHNNARSANNATSTARDCSDAPKMASLRNCIRQLGALQQSSACLACKACHIKGPGKLLLTRRQTSDAFQLRGFNPTQAIPDPAQAVLSREKCSSYC